MAILNKKNRFWKILRDFLFISAGILSAGLGLKGFLLPNKFIDGGVTGVSLLVSQITTLDVAFLIVIFNIPFIILGYRQISKGFAIRSVLAIVGLALCLLFIEYPTLTRDKLLISIFGGFFLGTGIGLAIRGGGVIDGTEVLAVYLTGRTPISIGGIILMINLVIFSFAALLLSLEIALYSILIYLAASKTVDFIVHGIEEYIGITIISSKSEEIRSVIIEKLSRGATIFRGKRGLTAGDDSANSDIDIIYTVLTRLETYKVRNEILQIDENAFVIEQSINDVKGGMVKKSRLQ